MDEREILDDEFDCEDSFIDEYPDLWEEEVVHDFVLIEFNGQVIAHQYVKQIWVKADYDLEMVFKYVPLMYTVEMPPLGHPAWNSFYSEIPF